MAKTKGEDLVNATQDAPLLVLVIDDEPSHAEVVAQGLERINAKCEIVHTAKEAKEIVLRQSFDVVVTDLMLETNDGGLQILKEVKDKSPNTEVVLMTASNEVETAVEAIRLGAYNYLQKPLDLKQLRSIVNKAGEIVRVKRDNAQLHQRLDEKFGFEGVIGSSPAMLKAVEMLKRIAPTDATVLILGETGTGKELFAQALHHNSLRKNKPFVALNCAAISESLLESELFGHLKGSFTGATEDRIGKFEYANGGTIFLDEVGDMPLSTQVKLLRVLESGEITQVGSNKSTIVNVRIVSATNKNLAKEVELGNFRQDLYHRLNVVTLRLPSLRERTGDVLVLLEYFMRNFCEKYKKTIKGVSQAAHRRLSAYAWPGNVRQLRNVAESIVVIDVDGLVDIDDIPDEINEATCNISDDIVEAAAPSSTSLIDLASQPATPAMGRTSAGAIVTPSPESEQSLRQFVGLTLEELERRFIQETLRHTHGNRSEAAKILSVNERTLYRRLKEYSQENKDVENGNL